MRYAYSMAASDQQLLDAARDALHDILLGKSEEFREGSESARMLRIAQLEKLIQNLEARIAQAAGSTFKQIREVRV